MKKYISILLFLFIILISGCNKKIEEDSVISQKIDTLFNVLCTEYDFSIYNEEFLQNVKQFAVSNQYNDENVYQAKINVPPFKWEEMVKWDEYTLDLYTNINNNGYIGINSGSINVNDNKYKRIIDFGFAQHTRPIKIFLMVYSDNGTINYEPYYSYTIIFKHFDKIISYGAIVLLQSPNNETVYNVYELVQEEFPLVNDEYQDITRDYIDKKVHNLLVKFISNKLFDYS